MQPSHWKAGRSCSTTPLQRNRNKRENRVEGVCVLSTALIAPAWFQLLMLGNVFYWQHASVRFTNPKSETRAIATPACKHVPLLCPLSCHWARPHVILANLLPGVAFWSSLTVSEAPLKPVHLWRISRDLCKILKAQRNVIYPACPLRSQFWSLDLSFRRPWPGLHNQSSVRRQRATANLNSSASTSMDQATAVSAKQSQILIVHLKTKDSHREP